LSTAGQPHARENDSALGDARVYARRKRRVAHDDDAPWNYMMAIAILYSLPPVAIFYALGRYMAAGLTAGSIKG
jgi:ABC-type glycerol-3-phosphate transport system permease component